MVNNGWNQQMLKYIMHLYISYLFLNTCTILWSIPSHHSIWTCDTGTKNVHIFVKVQLLSHSVMRNMIRSTKIKNFKCVVTSRFILLEREALTWLWTMDSAIYIRNVPVHYYDELSLVPYYDNLTSLIFGVHESRIWNGAFSIN